MGCWLLVTLALRSAELLACLACRLIGGISCWPCGLRSSRLACVSDSWRDCSPNGLAVSPFSLSHQQEWVIVAWLLPCWLAGLLLCLSHLCMQIRGNVSRALRWKKLTLPRSSAPRASAALSHFFLTKKCIMFHGAVPSPLACCSCHGWNVCVAVDNKYPTRQQGTGPAVLNSVPTDRSRTGIGGKAACSYTSHSSHSLPSRQHQRMRWTNNPICRASKQVRWCADPPQALLRTYNRSTRFKVANRK